MTDDDVAYFERLESRLDDAMTVAERAKAHSGDPRPEVEIPIAKDMADRVENLLGIDGVAERVRELDAEMSREEAALALAEDFAAGRVGDYETNQGKIEGAVRTAVALLTEGVVAAPIEGIDRVEVSQNDDGTEFVRVYYAGPIRSAGGTAQALSVLVGDYTRVLLGLDRFKPRNEEIERYAEEVALYDRETGLQYSPKDEETKFIARHCPVLLDGEATGDEEVSGFRDLERVATNNPRGGMCLVLAEGIALKAPKIKRYTSQLEEIEWPWLDDLIDGSIGDGHDDDAGDDPMETDDGTPVTDGPVRVEPAAKFLRDLIAGRPVFTHPSRAGGFRLRYGRARNHGFATAGIHPATMHVLDDFVATGTQIKTERPGKAAGVVPVDSIDGPTVKLANGDVRRIDDVETALELRNGIVEILDVGEYLVNYGEFVENNHALAPASYVTEWWIQDLDATGVDVQALHDAPDVDLDHPTWTQTLEWATEYDAPLHPAYTYLWHDIDVTTLDALVDAVAAGEVRDDVLVVDRTDDVQRALEHLLVEHRQRDELLVDEWRPLVTTLGFDESLDHDPVEITDAARDWPNAHRAVNELAPFTVQERAPTRIGNRMGRPEKSEKRDLSPAVHALFPIGEAGGSQRDFSKAAAYTADHNAVRGAIETDIGVRACADCDTHTFRGQCPDCGGNTYPHFTCPSCDRVIDPDEGGRVNCEHCDVEATNVERRTINLNDEYRNALDRVGERESAFPILKGVKGLMSKTKTPEPIEKGVLRAKHGVSTFKDGTVRYDMTDLPVTAVRPRELDVTVDHFRELGYDTDIHGDTLEHDDQLVELRVQDIVLSDGAAEHLLKTAAFVDDLLEQYYDTDPFYDLDDRIDLVGELVFGMAPHTSAAVVGRVIGFTTAAVGYAHPYFHAAKRRNCFHPDTKLWFEDEDGILRYERIETFVETRLRNPETDDFGTLTQHITDVSAPSLTESGDLVKKPVTAVSRHVAPDHLVRVETRSGRELTVTPDHEMRVFHDGALTTKSAASLTTDDSLVKPDRLDTATDATSIPEFDLLQEFIATDAVDNDDLMVKGLDKSFLYSLFEDRLGENWPGEFFPLKSTAEHLGLTKRALSNYVYRESIPAALLLGLFESPSDLADSLPADISLGMKRDTTEIDRFITVDVRVACLLGYYTAEGFSRWQTTPKGRINQTTVSGVEDAARDFFVDVFRTEFGMAPYEENEYKVTVSGRLPRVLFETILECGTSAKSKRVPECIFGAPTRVVAAYLSGYFSGDGSVEKRSLTVSATTVSPELKKDLVSLMTRLGITARSETIEPVRLVEKFPDYYEDDTDAMSSESFVIDITGIDAVRFGELVELHLPRKRRRLQGHIDDIVPSSRRVFDGGDGDYLIDEIAAVEYVESDCAHTYNLTVTDTHSVIVNDTVQKQCDGDEDCVMLMMDGLLNFSKEYLPDRRGGSVTADSRLVALDPAGNVRFLSFTDFWSELDAPVERDGKFEKRTCITEGWRTYAFDENHHASLEPIEKAIRYRSDDETILRIETQFGRHLDVTAHHSLFRFADGIEEVAGGELEPGDLIVAPRNLPFDTASETIDVLEHVNDPYVFIDDAVEGLLTEIWDDAEWGDRTRAAFDGGLSYRLSKRKLSAETFATVVESSNHDEPDHDVHVGIKGSATGISRFIEVDEDFGWFMGLFVAEGSLSGTRPTVVNSDETVIERAVDIARSTLGCEPNVRWSNKTYEVGFPAVFREVLYGLGFADQDSYRSSEKVVPTCILQSPRSVVKSFIQGLLAGDGCRSSNDNHTNITFYTTSEAVKDGVVFLLHRLGVTANVSYFERDASRQPIYRVTVAGGARDNPLQRVLDGEEPYLPKSLVVTIPDSLMALRELDIPGVKQIIPKYLKRRDNVSLEKLRAIAEELETKSLPPEGEPLLESIQTIVDGDLAFLRVKRVEPIEYDGYLYDLQVGGEPVFTANWLYAHNSMDAPLVMSSRIDPTEIDDEAHNMDIVDRYPREFYEATRRMADPGDVDIRIAEDTLDTDDAYHGFRHTHDTTNIAAGPALSAYKTLGSMMDKMNAQLELARKLRAVDETDVAERVIESHFLPDLIGNLRAFSRQETRCLDCGEKYRRVPLTGHCRECGGTVNLTVHHGSVSKYMQTALEVAEEYGAREYTKQRLKLLERNLESIFEDDTNKQSGIADFM